MKTANERLLFAYLIDLRLCNIKINKKISHGINKEFTFILYVYLLFVNPLLHELCVPSIFKVYPNSGSYRLPLYYIDICMIYIDTFKAYERHYN